MSEHENVGSNAEHPSAPKRHSLDEAVQRMMARPEEAPEPESEEPVESPETEAVAEDTEAEEPEVLESEESDLEEEEAPESEEYEEDEEEEAPEAEATPEEPEETYFTVKVDGEELEVNLQELTNGYQRQSDYTKKTQALSEDRKATEAMKAQFEEGYGQLQQAATIANEVLNRDLKKYESIDWETLKTEDPVQFVSTQLEMQEVHKQQEAIQQQLQMAYEQQQQVQQQEMAKAFEAERKRMLETFPEWKDDAVRDKEQMRIIEYARGNGYSDQELQMVTAKDLSIIEKARKFDELEAAKRAPAAKKTAPVARKPQKSKASKPRGTSQRKKAEAARSQLRKSGNLKDAAVAMYEQQMQQGKTIKK